MQNPQKTHFGYKEVSLGEKTRFVSQVFHSVADRYDLMNDLMSGGLHRLWKRAALAACGAKPGQLVLDLASGTGDLAAKLAKEVGKNGHVVSSDINDSMLMRGRMRLIDKGILSNVSFVQADAEQLPFPSNYFDRITMAFGLRNVTQKENALASMWRVLKPGGKLIVLEFSRVTLPLLRRLYDWYSFKFIPALGELVTDDRDSYAYLVESIRMHPDQETLKLMMEDAGFEDVEYNNLTAGVVALHSGYKY